VLIEDVPSYVRSWADVRFVPGVFAALRRLGASSYAVVLITNQSGIGRGILSSETACRLNQRLVEAIEAQGARVDAWYMCPHHPDDGCGCRKPAPGMLLRAASELGLDLQQSFFIGDAASDLAAARAAGVQGVLVLTGRGRQQLSVLKEEELAGCVVMPDLPSAVDRLLRQQPSA
jgi:D-glycero-D-manno-heptose 1,7-bisphosphate phosphatase